MEAIPKISVLMPVYNRQDFVSQAIESILAQTYPDFEFIIINDGSTDDTKKIVENYAKTDERIKLINNPTNLGLIDSLTIGLKYAQGEYIARMDSDDISLPDRFEKQLAYMEEHPDIGVVGCWFKWINADGVVSNPKSQRPCGSDLIWWGMFFFPELVHPTIFSRKGVYSRFNENNLEATFVHAEDHAFWLRIGFETRFDNLPEVLFYFRSHPGRITSNSNLLQQQSDENAILRGMENALARKVSIKAVQTIRSKLRDQPKPVAIEAIKTLFDLYTWFTEKYSISGKTLESIRRSLAFRIIGFFKAYLKVDVTVSFFSLFTFLRLFKLDSDLFYWIHIGVHKIRFLLKKPVL